MPWLLLFQEYVAASQLGTSGARTALSVHCSCDCQTCKLYKTGSTCFIPFVLLSLEAYQHLQFAAGEKEQRIVSLTAQLTTAYMKQAVAERR